MIYSTLLRQASSRGSLSIDAGQVLRTRSAIPGPELWGFGFVTGPLAGGPRLSNYSATMSLW